jgi:molybdopterin-guanine dinucleotide biosynthesis protein A
VNAEPGGPVHDAIILAGGRSARLGGIDKVRLCVGGHPLLDTVLTATRYAVSVVVVGDPPVPPHVLLTREEPAYAGPAAALVAGLRTLRENQALPPSAGGAAAGATTGYAGASPGLRPWTLVLAGDLPGAGRGVATLLAAVRDDGPDGYCLTGTDGQRQWLFGIYRSAALDAAASALGDPTNRSLGRLLGGLGLADVSAPPWATDDIDTWADLARWTSRDAAAEDDGASPPDDDGSSPPADDASSRSAGAVG